MFIDGIKMTTGSTITQSDGVTPYTANSPYDIAGSTLSKPTDGAVLMRFSVNRAFTIASDFTGSFAESVTAPTGSPVYLIKRNGANIGKFTFTANAAAFANDTELSSHAFAVGDILTVVAPATADATHDAISWTLAAVLP